MPRIVGCLVIVILVVTFLALLKLYFMVR